MLSNCENKQCTLRNEPEQIHPRLGINTGNLKMRYKMLNYNKDPVTTSKSLKICQKNKRRAEDMAQWAKAPVCKACQGPD